MVGKYDEVRVGECEVTDESESDGESGAVR